MLFFLYQAHQLLSIQRVTGHKQHLICEPLGNSKAPQCSGLQEASKQGLGEQLWGRTKVNAYILWTWESLQEREFMITINKSTERQVSIIG